MGTAGAFRPISEDGEPVHGEEDRGKDRETGCREGDPRRLQVVGYEHGYVAEPRPSVRQQICAASAAEPLPLTPRP